MTGIVGAWKIMSSGKKEEKTLGKFRAQGFLLKE
jgi:hypothetical protein